MILYASVICAVISLASGQDTKVPMPNLHAGLTQSIGNFSVELMFFAAQAQNATQNLIISPMTVWTLLAVISEGAVGTTQIEVRRAARIGYTEFVRKDFARITQYLVVNTSTVELFRLNAIFVDRNLYLERDFQAIARNHYATNVTSLNFAEANKVSKLINNYISEFTRNRLNNIVDPSTFDDAKMLMLSALYFKGQWSSPFNASQTEKRPFYNNNGEVIGQVNMMYNRAPYAFSNIPELQARIIELPYGQQNRLSMLIMLPNLKVSLNQMVHNLKNVTLDYLFDQMRISSEEFADDEVDCFIPRFKIESKLNLNDALKSMKIIKLFQSNAELNRIARYPIYVDKVIHKAEIEVTEEGTTASAVTVAEFANRIGAIRFEANRPFAYMIIEKSTNSIAFAGIYQHPSLY